MWNPWKKKQREADARTLEAVKNLIAKFNEVMDKQRQCIEAAKRAYEQLESVLRATKELHAIELKAARIVPGETDREFLALCGIAFK